jgi:hypothetical protein
MTRTAVLLIALLSATSVRCADGDLDVSEWVSGMLKRLPFAHGELDRLAFKASSRAYLDGIVSAYVTSGGKMKASAERAGDAIRAATIDDRTRRLVDGATAYVKDTEAGMLATLDPEGSGGTIRLKDARRRLTDLAVLADMDGNKVLDRYEAALAEAAFAKGRDLALPGEASRLMRELDETPFARQ